MKTVRRKRHLFSLFILLSIFCALIFAVNPKLASAAYQLPDFYYYYTEKIYLDVSTEMITICFEQNVSDEDKAAWIRGDPILTDISDEIPPFGLVLITLKEGSDKADIAQALERLNSLPEIKYSTPVFEYSNLKLILMDEFVVRFKPDMTEEDIETLNKENGVGIVRKSPYRHNRYVLRVIDPKDTTAMEMANTYNENPRALYGTPNFLVMGGYQNTEPNDTYFPSQWALDNTGQDPPAGTPDADINAPEGWDISTGSSDIVIAIIDSGVDIDHEDLAAKIWGNEDEQTGDGNGDGRPGVKDVDDDGDGLIDEDSEGREPGDPGYTNDLVDDDDENGYPDDFYGWNFENGNNDPRGTYYHGTACAGLAAAETDNEKGVAGVCWAGKIMPLAIGTLGPYFGAEAIDYASANGADVLSNSWGVSPDSDLTDAIIAAKNNGRGGKGCVIVFAAGNTSGSVSYPATLNETIAVGATDEDDVRWDYSAHGNELDVVAPSGPTKYGYRYKELIFWTTDITGSGGENPGDTSEGDAAGNYTKWFGGTSAAAPEVAGLAGLILSINPNLTSDEVQSIIESTADDQIGDPSEDTEGLDPYYGWGRINLYNALTYKPPLLVLTKDDNDVGCVVPGDYITYTISYDANGHSVNDVNIVDYLPEEVDFNSASGPNMTYDSDSNTVTWKIGSLSPTDSNSVTLTVKVVKVNDCIPGCGTITNFCEAESDSAYNTAEASTPVCSASSPEPTCGAIVVDVGELNLTWCPGLFAADVDGHEVYFGSDFNDVNDADINDVNVYKGTVTNPCYTLRFNTLDLHTTYYWRIDEVNDPDVWRGGVWSFTTGNYFVVDDFDSYARNEDLQAVWNDYRVNGSRADVYRETSIAHDVNSMRYYYGNSSSPYYAEADAYTTGPDSLPSQIGSDWTAGASALVLYFYGQSGNDANEQMYVRLHDADSNAVVTYGDYGDDPNDLRLEQWQEWNIDLNDFNSAGVDLTNVTRITIGFGDGNAPDGDGEGTVYFDDIRLYIYCLSRQASEYYDDWLAWGKPNCWCYARQCRGDIDGLKYGPLWVQVLDLGLFKLAFNKSDDELPPEPGGICADLNHTKHGPLRVQVLDLDIFKLYFNKGEASVPACDQSPIITGPYNFWTTPEQQQRQSGQPGDGKSATEPVDIEALIEWMEELWLTDEQLREQFSKADWLEFIETVRETPIY